MFRTWNKHRVSLKSCQIVLDWPLATTGQKEKRNCRTLCAVWILAKTKAAGILEQSHRIRRARLLHILSLLSFQSISQCSITQYLQFTHTHTHTSSSFPFGGIFHFHPMAFLFLPPSSCCHSFPRIALIIALNISMLFLP